MLEICVAKATQTAYEGMQSVGSHRQAQPPQLVQLTGELFKASLSGKRFTERWLAAGPAASEPLRNASSIDERVAGSRRCHMGSAASGSKSGVSSQDSSGTLSTWEACVVLPRSHSSTTAPADPTLCAPRSIVLPEQLSLKAHFIQSSHTCWTQLDRTGLHTGQNTSHCS